MSKRKKGKSFRIIPIYAKPIFRKFDLPETCISRIRSSGEALQDGDIVVISSKYAAVAEGRFVDLRKIRPSSKAKKLASEYQLDPSLAELVCQESESILGGIPGFLLAISKGILAPNAGIDRSNAPKNYAILYPKDPTNTARRLKSKFDKSIRKGQRKKGMGVILNDSRVTPTRLGTIGIAIAAAGFKPVIDFRGKEDLFGNRLKVTVKAVADQLASAAELVMGEANEAIPIALVRGYDADYDEKGSLSTQISARDDIYLRSLNIH